MTNYFMAMKEHAAKPLNLLARYAGISGSLSIIAYFTVAFTELPDNLCFLGAMLFPVLGIVAAYFLKNFIASRQDGHGNRLAFIFAVAAYCCCAIFLSAQLAVNILVTPAHNTLQADTLSLVRQAVRSIDMGIDVAWDIFIGSYLISLSVALWPLKGYRYWGLVGAVLALLLLVLNIYTFPIPPADKNLQLP